MPTQAQQGANVTGREKLQQTSSNSTQIQQHVIQTAYNVFFLHVLPILQKVSLNSSVFKKQNLHIPISTVATTVRKEKNELLFLGEFSSNKNT